MKEFCKARKRVEVTVGESVKIMREFQELGQNISLWPAANLTGNGSGGFWGFAAFAIIPVIQLFTIYSR